jgi:hypothetical protein
MTLLRQFSFAIATLFITWAGVCAQEAPLPPDIIQANAKRCQLNTIHIANSGAVAQTTNERMFVVTRLGTGETSHRLSQRRLADIKAEYGDNFRNGKIVLTEGARVRGLGRVEFYLGSKLYWVTLLPRNADFCSGCCDRHRLYK